MLYRVTVQAVSDHQELRPPDSKLAWRVEAVEVAGNGDALVIIWQFDDVQAKQRADRRAHLVDQYVRLQHDTDRAVRALEYAAQSIRLGNLGEPAIEIEAIYAALSSALDLASQPYQDVD